jgi:dienelactone hydrolase
MIVGIHGLGNPDNSQQIRQYLSPFGEAEGMVVACPDPYLNDQPRSKAVLDQAIDSLLEWYNIDENQKYIIGYSAGSDVAAKYVLELEKHKFKGLVWFAPGFHSITSVPNQTEIPPVCLCVGTSDFVSLAQANIIRNAFNNSSVPFLYNTISGVAHTMDFPSFPAEVKKCVDFIDENATLSSQKTFDKNSIKIYPNPSKEILNIEFLNDFLDNENTVIIYDLLGKEVLKMNQNANSKISFSTESFVAGTYVLSIVNNQQIINFKWMKN